jgi:arabinofuranan 3-O-arabinosyltransferase
LFAAGAGVLFLARVLGWRGAGTGAAALAYALTPYVLDYSARISAILMPWAGLPWMIGATALALRRGGWRWPAFAAIVVALTGSVNATALAFAGIGPLLWVGYAVWVAREVPWRRALAAVARIGGLCVAVSMWWIVALAVQGRFGIPILRYTETYEAVSRTSTPTEVLRGLGYWFFYGRDKVAPWVVSGPTYTQSMPVLVVSFAIPALALLVAAGLRFVHRAFVLALLVVGTVVSVGSFPYAHPSVYGRLFKSFVLSPLGLSMRSTPRAVPLVALAEALLLGVGVAWTASTARAG